MLSTRTHHGNSRAAQSARSHVIRIDFGPAVKAGGLELSAAFDSELTSRQCIRTEAGSSKFENRSEREGRAAAAGVASGPSKAFASGTMKSAPADE